MGYLHTKKLTTPLLSIGFYFFCLDMFGFGGVFGLICALQCRPCYTLLEPAATSGWRVLKRESHWFGWFLQNFWRTLMNHINIIQYSIYLRIPIVDSTCCWKFFSATLNSCNFLGFSPENNQDCPWQWCHQKPGWQENTHPALPAHLFISQINQQQRSHPTNLIKIQELLTNGTISPEKLSYSRGVPSILIHSRYVSPTVPHWHL